MYHSEIRGSFMSKSDYKEKKVSTDSSVGLVLDNLIKKFFLIWGHALETCMHAVLSGVTVRREADNGRKDCCQAWESFLYGT